MTLGFAPAAPADVPVSQVVKAEQTRPRAGSIAYSFKNYARDRCTTQGKTQQIERCRGGYRKSQGKLQVNVTTYVVKENLRDDVYLIETKIRSSNLSGSSRVGAFAVATVTKGKGLVDSSENRDFRKNSKCKRVPVSLSAGVPGASVSASGNVDFCGDLTRMTREGMGRRKSEFTVDGLPGMQETTLVRWVRVKKGRRPSFDVFMRMQNDSCTSAKHGWCQTFDNSTYVRKISIGTT